MRYVDISEIMEKFGHCTEENIHELEEYLAGDDVYLNKLEYDTDVLLNDIMAETIGDSEYLTLPNGKVKINYVDFEDRTLCFVNYQLDDYELYDSKQIGYIVFRYLKHKKNVHQYSIVLIYYTNDDTLIEHHFSAMYSMPSHYIHVKFSKHFQHNDIYYCYGGGGTSLTNELRQEIIKQLEDITS